jgi:O-Antigen ligase
MKALWHRESKGRGVAATLLAFPIVSIALAFSPASKGLIVLVPAAGFGLAWYLQRRFPRYYVGLVCWLFILTPMLRRMIEFRAQANNATFIMIAPFLACWAGLGILRGQVSSVRNARLRTWLFVVIALLYGAAVGFLQNSPMSVIQDWLGWSSPLCFAVYLYVQREHAKGLLDSFRANMIAGTIVMGLYGLWQFFFITPWDAFWMETTTLTSIGSPDSMQVRVFSTMNTPQPLADFLLCGLFLSLAAKGRARFIATPLSILVVGLSMSRSAWVCGAIGLVVFSLETTPRQRVRLISSVAACLLALFLAFQLPGIGDTLSRRMETFSSLRGDGSVNDRLANQQRAITAFEDSPFGLGMGVAARHDQASATYGVPPAAFVINDNGIEAALLSFGWFGSVIFAIGFGGAVITVWRQSRDPELMALKVLLLSLVIQIPSLHVFAGASGFLIWGAIGFCFAMAGGTPEISSPRGETGQWASSLARET